MKQIVKLHNLDDLQVWVHHEVLQNWNHDDDLTNRHVLSIRELGQKHRSTISPTAVAQIIAAAFTLDKSTTIRVMRRWVDKIIANKKKMRGSKQKAALQTFMSSVLIQQPRLSICTSNPTNANGKDPQTGTIVIVDKRIMHRNVSMQFNNELDI